LNMTSNLASAKYVVYANIEVDGVVEKPDVVGALFGQTEGLLGEDLDLRQLQEKGKIARIQVEVQSKNGKTLGEIVIPSNLDRNETALIGAAIENVDKVGPCPARISVSRIVDLREARRQQVLERARQLLQKWNETAPESKEIVEELVTTKRTGEITKYGPDQLPAGPDVLTAEEVLIVEGRADVVNLLKYGYRNAVGIEGVTISPSIADLSKKKRVTAFVDGDRGGELILKELMQIGHLDYIARAPRGREVEELTGKEIMKALENRMTAEAYLQHEKGKPFKKVDEIPSEVKSQVEQIKGTLEALLYGQDWALIKKIPVRDLADTLKAENSTKAVLFDGLVTQRLVDIAADRKIQYLVGVRIGEVPKKPLEVKILTFQDLS
jgi:DNA primase